MPSGGKGTPRARRRPHLVGRLRGARAGGCRLPAGRVLAEIAGPRACTATELGPSGYLRRRRDHPCARSSERNGLAMVGGFVPGRAGRSRQRRRDARPRAAPELLAAAGAEVFVAAVRHRTTSVVARRACSTTARLPRRVGDGLDELAVASPPSTGCGSCSTRTSGTLVETRRGRRAHARQDTSVPLVPRHRAPPAIGGYDPVAFASRAWAIASATCT